LCIAQIAINKINYLKSKCVTPNNEKDAFEKAMCAKARELIKQKKAKERKSLLDQSAEISRRKSKKAEHH